jgi:glycosyltransferase involved in cell wall biosynthesis
MALDAFPEAFDHPTGSQEDQLVNVHSDSETPKISVIIPAYNHETYILDAVRSVLEQTCTDFELIIIDDGSTDGTLAKIQNLQDGRIRVFHQDNQGAAKTINRGIGLARGTYISILNSDDLYTPDRLEKLAIFLDGHEDVVLASSLIQPVDSLGGAVLAHSRYAYWLEWYDQAIRQFHQDRLAITPLLKYNFFVTTSNIFVRSTIFKNEGMFHESLSYCHDYEFFLRLLIRYPFHLLDERLLMYRLHEMNTIRENEFLRFLEIMYAIFSVLDMREFFRHSLPERINSLVFKGLSENPEINPYMKLMEADRCLKDFQKQIIELHQRLEEMDGWMRNLQFEVAARDLRLNQANGRLRDQQIQIQNQQTRIQDQQTQMQDQQTQMQNQQNRIQDQQTRIQDQQTRIETKERLLQEIYSSKGWRFLTRYRVIKYRLSCWKKLPLSYWKKLSLSFREKLSLSCWKKPSWSFMEKISPSLWKKRSLSASDNVPCDEIVGENKHSENNDIPHHASIIHPVRQDRIKVTHAIANFMMGEPSRLVIDLFEHLGHKYDQEVVSCFVPADPVYTGIKIHNFAGDVSERDIAVFLRKKGTSILHVHYLGDCDDPWYKKVFAAAGNSSCIVIENINTPTTYNHDRINHYVYVNDFTMNFTEPVRGKSTVIYPGNNFALFQRHGAAIPDDVIGMVYRIEPDKLGEDSIQVFTEVVKRRPQTKAYIVGGGAVLSHYKERVADHGLTDRFVFTDYVPHEQLPDYYRKFSLFVAPVWKAGFGQLSLLAMGMEIPVVGYDVGVLSEILGGKDCLGKDTAGLTDIIINLLDDRKRRMDIGKANRARVIERFSLDAMIKQYDDLYARLLVRRKTGHAR